MDDTEKGKIALLLFKDSLRREGFEKLTPEFFEKNVHQTHVATKVGFDKAREFLEEIIRELFEEMLSSKTCSHKILEKNDLSNE